MICDGCKEEVLRARWRENDKWFCKRCDPGASIPNIPGALFPFTTSNFDGNKIEVQSLRHLRKLESAYGMHNVAFNTDSKSWDLPPRERRQ